MKRRWWAVVDKRTGEVLTDGGAGGPWFVHATIYPKKANACRRLINTDEETVREVSIRVLPARKEKR